MLEPHLDPKTQLLVALGSAVAAKCQPCFSGLYSKVSDIEATDQEVRAAVAIANQVVAKSHDFMVAFVEETTKGEVSVNADGSETGSCACS
jgi:alkylhydroperoxidase/carboxymuconolactone decarboxylase family protein YurZ